MASSISSVFSANSGARREMRQGLVGGVWGAPGYGTWRIETSPGVCHGRGKAGGGNHRARRLVLGCWRFHRVALVADMGLLAEE